MTTNPMFYFVQLMMLMASMPLQRGTYDALGQVVLQTDAVGREVNFGYDGVGNLIFTSIPQDRSYYHHLRFSQPAH